MPPLPAAPVSARIVEYEQTLPEHHAGTVDTAVLEAIERLVPRPVSWSMETGCGKTTILLSNLSERHVVFAIDDRAWARSSVRYYEECPASRRDRITPVPGPTQRTLPGHRFEQPIDVALLDGPHAYPCPELEYYWVYPHLRPGGMLIVDDIHIPTIRRLHAFLAEDEMFELVHVERMTSFFRRTMAPTFRPDRDGWEHQRFNKARFPEMPGAEDWMARTARAEAARAGESIAALEARVVDLTREVDWWKHVADQRRLKRRLSRRLGPLARWLVR